MAQSKNDALSKLDLTIAPAETIDSMVLQHYGSTQYDKELFTMITNLTERGQLATRYTEPRNLYGWDCESVLVLNKDSVFQI